MIRESKTTGIASYFEAFESEVSAKDGLKLRCENVKLFLREPYAVNRQKSAVGRPWDRKYLVFCMTNSLSLYGRSIDELYIFYMKHHAPKEQTPPMTCFSMPFQICFN